LSTLEKDQGIPLDTVDKMKAALATGSPAARASQFVAYPKRATDGLLGRTGLIHGL